VSVSRSRPWRNAIGGLSKRGPPALRSTQLSKLCDWRRCAAQLQWQQSAMAAMRHGLAIAKPFKGVEAQAEARPLRDRRRYAAQLQGFEQNGLAIAKPWAGH